MELNIQLPALWADIISSTFSASHYSMAFIRKSCSSVSYTSDLSFFFYNPSRICAFLIFCFHLFLSFCQLLIFTFLLSLSTSSLHLHFGLPIVFPDHVWINLAFFIVHNLDSWTILIEIVVKFRNTSRNIAQLTFRISIISFGTKNPL